VNKILRAIEILEPEAIYYITRYATNIDTHNNVNPTYCVWWKLVIIPQQKIYYVRYTIIVTIASLLEKIYKCQYKLRLLKSRIRIKFHLVERNQWPQKWLSFNGQLILHLVWRWK